MVDVGKIYALRRGAMLAASVSCLVLAGCSLGGERIEFVTAKAPPLPARASGSPTAVAQVPLVETAPTGRLISALPKQGTGGASRPQAVASSEVLGATPSRRIVLRDDRAPTLGSDIESENLEPLASPVELPSEQATTKVASLGNASLARSAELEAARQYRVRSGDTLSAIARAQGTTVDGIVRANDLGSASRITVGQVLRIPAAAKAASPQAPTPEKIRASLRTADSGKQSDVQPGIELRKPQAAEESAPARLPVPATKSAPQAVAEAAPAKPAPASAPLLPLDKPAAAAPRKVASVAPAAGLGGDEDPVLPRRHPSRFLWPVAGEIVVPFGPTTGGLRNDGVNIRAARGTPVQVAEDGVVAYIGNELRGFGNLVLVKHDDSWVTAYAHVDEILVDLGSEVKRGQAIATVGTSGSVESPQLHFEVRKGREALNPEKILAPRFSETN